MNIQAHSYNKEKVKSHWALFILYFLIVVITEPFYRQSLFDVSIPLIESLQGSEPKKKVFLQIAEFISTLGNSQTFVPIILLFYNFTNIYKTFVLLNVMFLSTMMISVLKMIYVSPRPYWVSEKIVPFGCEGGWGNPSGHSIASTAFYLSVWHMAFESSYLKPKKGLKWASLGFTIILIIIIMFSRILVGAHALNQIFYGASLGLAIYFLLFHVLCIRVNDGKQLAKFMEFRNLIYGCVNFFIFLFAFLLYFFNQNQETLNKWDNVISSHGCPNIKKNLRLQNEGFVVFCVFLGNLGAFVGLKMEYYVTFGENLQNWIQYNFEVDEKSDDESLMTKISINKETQWNHTNSFFSILRLVTLCILAGVFLLPFYFIDTDDNIFVVAIFKFIFPVNIVSFSIFFLFKVILKSLRMVNMTLFSMLQDSI
jgi:membrane-associated phospholipid phosphatase